MDKPDVLNYSYIIASDQMMLKGDNNKIRNTNCHKSCTDVEVKEEWRREFMLQVWPIKHVCRNQILVINKKFVKQFSAYR
jgi:hypothetical protein